MDTVGTATIARETSSIEDQIDSIVKHYDLIYEKELSKLIELPLNTLDRAIKVSRLQSYVAQQITTELLKLHQHIKVEGCDDKKEEREAEEEDDEDEEKEHDLNQLDEMMDALLGAIEDLEEE